MPYIMVFERGRSEQYGQRVGGVGDVDEIAHVGHLCLRLKFQYEHVAVIFAAPPVGICAEAVFHLGPAVGELHGVACLPYGLSGLGIVEMLGVESECRAEHYPPEMSVASEYL